MPNREKLETWLLEQIGERGIKSCMADPKFEEAFLDYADTIGEGDDLGALEERLWRKAELL